MESASVHHPSQALQRVGRFLRRNPLFGAALLAIAGILVGHWGLLPSGVMLALGLAWLIMLTWRRRRAWLVLLVFFVFEGLHRERKQDSESLVAVSLIAEASEDPIAQVRGIVTTRPERFGRNRMRFVVQANEIDGIMGIPVFLRGKLLAVTPAMDMKQGDRVVLSGSLRNLAPPRNPGQFDRSRLLRERDRIHAELIVGATTRIEVRGASWKYRILQHANNIRDHVEASLVTGLDPESVGAQVIRAMVLGDREAAEYDTEEPFRRSGALHIFAVSGLHVGIVALILWVILGFGFGLSYRRTIPILMGAVILYAFITGLPPSAVRASIMLVIVLAGFLLRRQARILNSLGLAALIILTFDSWQLFAAGFQLSFLVLIFIVALAPRLKDWAYPLCRPDPFIPPSLLPTWRRRLDHWGWARVADTFAVSTAAWIGSVFIIALVFRVVNVVGIAANICLVPFVFAILFLGVLSVLFGAVGLGVISSLINMLNAAFAHVAWLLASWFSSFPGAQIQLPDSDRAPVSPPGIVVFDTARSCNPVAIHLPSTTGGADQNWLIDTGSEGFAAGVLLPWLERQQVKHLDGLIATHGETGHIGGAGVILEEIPVDQIWTNPLPSRSPAQLALEERLGGRPDSTAEFRTPESAPIRLEVVYPPPGFPDQARSDDDCMVVLLHWEDWRLLVTSDAGFIAEKWLLRHRSDLRADVIIRSHHASDYESLPEFLRMLSPKVIIATNTGFPEGESLDPAWLDFLKRLDISLIDQAEAGAVSIYLERDALVLEPFLGGDRIRLRP